MERTEGGPLKIFHGSANPALARSIARHLGLPVGDCEVTRFNNGEIQVIVNESVRGDDCFVVQPTCSPPNETLMELLIMIDALRRASARRVTAVMPFYGYARQDRKTRGREPITAKLVANLLTTAQADRILTMDLHAGQIQGFFDIPVDHLTAIPLLADHVAAKKLPELTIISPDVGGAGRARTMAERLGATFGIVEKRRPKPGVSEVLTFIGEVRGRTAVIVDDSIDTGGTVLKAIDALVKAGARSVYFCCTHAILSGNAARDLLSSPVREVVVTDTIPVSVPENEDRVVVLSVAPMLAEAMQRIHDNLSVSRMFE